MHFLFTKIDPHSYIKERISTHTLRAVLSDPFKHRSVYIRGFV